MLHQIQGNVGVEVLGGYNPMGKVTPGEHQQAKSTRYYTVEKLSARQSITKEGFLLCEAVPIARIGTMLYGPDETDSDPGKDDFVRIERDGSEVFRPETIASFEGKPV